MFLFLKEILVIGVSIITALFISVGLTPERAVAPDLTPPAVIEKPGTSTPEKEVIDTPVASSTSESTATKEPEEPAPAITPPKEVTPDVSPLITDYEKSLKEALDALAKIQEEQSQKPLETPTDLNGKVRNAVVNILCMTEASGPLSPISGSGVLIDPRGIVITNAHVAQYFLLKNYPSNGSIQCIIRTGSPATPAYTADLLFLPPTWIAQNAQKIDDEHPVGNGEHDYALVQITGTIKGGTVPGILPYLPIATTAPDDGDPMLLAAYPAGFLGGTTIQKELYATSANVNVRKLYTYETSTVDLFDIGGSIVSQQGSSGGAAAREDGALSGLIVTSSDAPDTASRELRALSTEYIIRDFAKERGMPLQEYLGRNLDQERSLFWLNTAPTLSAALINVLEQ